MSPKVWAPAIVGIIVGFGLILAGDGDTATIVFLATAAQLGIGVGAPPGQVESKER